MCPVQLNVLQLSSCRQLAWAKKKGNEMECFGRNTKVRSSSHHDFPIIPLKSLISLYLSSSLISSHYQSYIICKPILTSHDIIYIYTHTVTHCIILYQYCIIFYLQYIYPLYDICPDEASFLHSLTSPWHPTAWIEDNSTARHLEGRCDLQVSVQVTQPAWRNVG